MVLGITQARWKSPRVNAQITTVIPTYRRPRMLRRAILSAVGQADVDVEVRVFDNCSGDETGSIAEALAHQYARIHYRCHPRNIGAHANFEIGVCSVETPFFSILSDDDYLLPGFYRHALDGLAANPAAMFWIGVTLNVDEGGMIWDARLERWPREGLYSPPEGALAMVGGLAPTWTGIVFRREVLDLAGFVDPETRGPSDLDFTLRLAARFPYLFEKIPVAVFTLSADSFSATQPLSSFWPGWLKMFNNIENIQSLDAPTKSRLLNAVRCDGRRMLFRRGVNALANRRTDFACDAASALEAAYPGRLRPWVLRLFALALDTVPWTQMAFTPLYQRFERRIIRSRGNLQERHGHLLRQL